MKENFQLNYSKMKPSMFNEGARINKANKTVSVLKDYLNATSNLILLDIGSSTGIMTNEYAKHFKKVIGIDIDIAAIKYAKNQFNRKNIEFICSPIEKANLPSESFDVITCSQIYEHVPSDSKLLDEIYRLLKPDGVCYFAAGNRFKIVEPHYKLPFLSYLPKKVANLYLRVFTKHDYYYENLKSLRNLKTLVSKFEIIDYTLKVISNPSKYSAEEMLKENTLKFFIFNFLANRFYFLIPTYIWILKKNKN